MRRSAVYFRMKSSLRKFQENFYCLWLDNLRIHRYGSDCFRARCGRANGSPSEATAYINRKTGELITLAHENQRKNEKNLCNALGIKPTSPKRCSRVKARVPPGALGNK